VEGRNATDRVLVYDRDGESSKDNEVCIRGFTAIGFTAMVSFPVELSFQTAPTSESLGKGLAHDDDELESFPEFIEP
jgi:hypothetical protein